MQCDCKICVRAYHFEINPLPVKVKLGTYEDHSVCHMKHIEHQNTAGRHVRIEGLCRMALLRVPLLAQPLQPERFGCGRIHSGIVMAVLRLGKLLSQ